MKSSNKIRIAVVGIGNCASSLIQGLNYYKNADKQRDIVGLMHPVLGGYSIKDIKIVAAFDVNQKKVGKDVSEAIYAFPNNTTIFAKVPRLNVSVHNAQVFDSIGEYVKEKIKISKDPINNPVKILREAQAEVLINYLPVGSQRAVEHWANICLEAKIGMVNCMPVFIASDKVWSERFKKAGIPIIGDDIKSQVGATIVHRTLLNLFLERGMPIDKTYQLNVGGNTDFQNMLERNRLTSKKISKTQSVTSQILLKNQKVDADNVYIGPSDFVPWLKDNKVAFIRIESRHFGDVPMNLELRLSVEDSPNSAGVVIDAIRCAKLALDHQIGGVLAEPSSYFMKSPPVQYTDAQARLKVEEFIEKYTGIEYKM